MQAGLHARIASLRSLFRSPVCPMQAGRETGDGQSMSQGLEHLAFVRQEIGSSPSQQPICDSIPCIASQEPLQLKSLLDSWSAFLTAVKGHPR